MSEDEEFEAEIYQTIIQSILVYGAEVWQIPTRETNKNLSTEMDVLRRSARKSRMERITNEQIKKKMGVKRQPDIIDIIERKDYNSMATSKG
jgi:hypothetical protein